MTIEAYLAALRRRLWHRPFTRGRILEEVEAHLRDSAREVGEDEAIRRFGAAEAVAALYAPHWGLIGGTIAVAGLVVALGAGENLLPPAPWPSAAAAPASVRVPMELATVVGAMGALALLLRHAVLGPLALAVAALLALSSGLRRAWLYDVLGVPGMPWHEVAGQAVWLGVVAAVALVAAVAERASTS